MILQRQASDYFERSNVYQFDGIEKFKASLEVLKAAVRDYPDSDLVALEHFCQCALLYLFDQDPDSEDLEKEKRAVAEESRMAQIRNAERMAENERKQREQEKANGFVHSDEEDKS